MQIVNSHQNNNAKKIVIIDDSSRESNIKKAAKYLSVLTVGGALGFGAKAIVDIFKNKQCSIVVNGEILEYLRRRFDVKPSNWEKNPRYYFIKFLDKLMKYNNEISDDELMVTLKYLILAVVPTSNTNDSNFFGGIVSSILNEMQQQFSSVYVQKLLTIAANDNSKLAKWLLTDNMKDTDFLKKDAKVFFTLDKGERLAGLVDLLKDQRNVKEGIKKYFSDLSFNFKKMDFSQYGNATTKEKINFEKNEKRLDENDLVTIKELYDSVETDQKIKNDIINQKDKNKNFGGYKLGLLFSDLMLKTTIFQIFGARQAKK